MMIEVIFYLLIRHEANSADTALVPVKNPDAGLSHSDVPNANRSIIGSACEDIAIPVENIKA